MNWLVSLLIGTIAGFIFWKLVAGKYEGDKPERSIHFTIGNYFVHLHHWLWCLVILMILLILGLRNHLLIGFLIGSIIQGLTYRDWYYVVYLKTRYKEIYSKFGSRKF